MEEWRPVPGWEGRYEVSSYGRVWSVARGVVMTLHWHRRENGYLAVWLRRPGAHHKRFVHRLVGDAFFENTDDYPVVNHKDRDRGNNRLDNLEWCTFKENSQHWMRTPITLPKEPVMVLRVDGDGIDPADIPF